ncbi:hypothetical protein Tsubulata_045314 [Turnera subulata]|uniref:Cyanate lyase C-terminal domain-containing protein n=1 Tax=Turnera subulata TaxID=218843 RepID=A0A9Q0FER6_9ROSI|nr:hypothetical protein Tsubulata_045314 [Turnera subulata]
MALGSESPKSQLATSSVSEYPPSSLSRIVSLLQTHRFLSDCLPDSSDFGKLIQRWKSAFDDWIARLLSLLVTTTECILERFMSSYSVWFEKLFVHIQSTLADSQFVKVGGCLLDGFPNVKKEGTSSLQRHYDTVSFLPQASSFLTGHNWLTLGCFGANALRLMHYGESIKEIINEEFGDGIMSAIDFYCTVDKVKAADGKDRVY